MKPDTEAFQYREALVYSDIRKSPCPNIQIPMVWEIRVSGFPDIWKLNNYIVTNNYIVLWGTSDRHRCSSKHLCSLEHTCIYSSICSSVYLQLQLEPFCNSIGFRSDVLYPFLELLAKAASSNSSAETAGGLVVFVVPWPHFQVSGVRMKPRILWSSNIRRR